MKSYNHLWEQFISTDNIILAEKNAGKGKRKNNKRHKQLREQCNFIKFNSKVLNFC